MVHHLGHGVQGELPTQIGGQLHGVLVYGGKIGGVGRHVVSHHGTALVGVSLGLQDLKGNVGVIGGQPAVSGGAGMPRSVVPGQGLDHTALVDQSVDTGVGPGLVPELQKGGRVGLGHTGGVDHDTLGHDGLARLVAVALGENVLGELHTRPPAHAAQIYGEGPKASPHFYARTGCLLYVPRADLQFFFARDIIFCHHWYHL